MSGPTAERYFAGALVQENQVTDYSIPRDEALYIIHDTYSLGYRWDLIYGFDNSNATSDYKTTIEHTYKTRTTTSNQDEISKNIGLQLGGWSFEIGSKHVTISEKEVTEESRQVTQIHVKAGEKLYFIKRRLCSELSPGSSTTPGTNGGELVGTITTRQPELKTLLSMTPRTIFACPMNYEDPLLSM